jgi:hypothetical protein
LQKLRIYATSAKKFSMDRCGMNRVAAGVFGAVVAFSANIALATPKTYIGVTNHAGAVSIVVDLITDGTLGALGASNITSMSIFLTDNGVTNSDENIPGSALNYNGGLIATATTVSFDFDITSSVLNAGNVANNICFSGSNACGGAYAPELTAVFNSVATQTPASGEVLIATTNIPEPTSIVVMAAGLAMLGGAVRRKHARRRGAWISLWHRKRVQRRRGDLLLTSGCLLCRSS